MSYTKGPWVANGRYVGVPNHRSMIAECRDNNGNWGDDKMSLANARFIAEAPNLLAMLEHAVHWHDQLTKDDIARYQAVISKAKGE